MIFFSTASLKVINYGFLFVCYSSREKRGTSISCIFLNLGCFLSKGSIKYSISAISNSLTLSKPFLGAISFLKASPITELPNGSFPFLNSSNLLKFIKIDYAVSGLKYPFKSPSGPIFVSNIKLKVYVSLNLFFGLLGLLMSYFLITSSNSSVFLKLFNLLPISMYSYFNESLISFFCSSFSIKFSIRWSALKCSFVIASFTI